MDLLYNSGRTLGCLPQLKQYAKHLPGELNRLTTTFTKDSEVRQMFFSEKECKPSKISKASR